MTTEDYEWDDNKARENEKRHKISFKEAAAVFLDPSHVTFSDPVHSISEDRFIAIGRGIGGKLLAVVYTERGKMTRIISARRATKSERRKYEEEKD